MENRIIHTLAWVLSIGCAVLFGWAFMTSIDKLHHSNLVYNQELFAVWSKQYGNEKQLTFGEWFQLKQSGLLQKK